MTDRRKKTKSKDGVEQPWYSEGLHFECQPDCGACCTNHEDYAYVYLEGDDVDCLTAFLEIEEELFFERYTSLDEGYLVLRMDQPECPFLEGKRCTVHAARPTQCRTFPFWEETLATRRRWSALRKFCPGIDRGERHSLQVIQSHIAERGRGD